MATTFWQRDLASSFDDARDTLSSWDKCMDKNYCKWPVIVGIIIGSLILISVLICIIRCACCGAACCCSCMSCCTSCCPSGGRKHKNHESLPSPAPMPYDGPIDTQYASRAGMPMYGAGFPSSVSTYGSSAPQYAQFDASTNKGGKFNEDALPAMPSWDTATQRKVQVEIEEEEPPRNQEVGIAMKPLDRDGSLHADYGNTHSATSPMLPNAAGAPLRSPVSPYAQTRSQSNDMYTPQSRTSPDDRSTDPYFRQPQQNSYNTYDSPYQINQESGVLTSTGGQRTQSPPRDDYRYASPAPYTDNYRHNQRGFQESAYDNYPPSGYDAYQPPQQVNRRPVDGSWRDI
ncbi:hypothetical protein M501DRAFT_991778 [Patellaria atrata CBS 101060]|uniref:Fibroin-3 related protein n=1 Tax=Patellaria atrata CBS 101060 TaxID=1346257 RepID=A0A9P4SBW0_9PEZI|nr:hypothetical protein M501DRAFT_991778 [Patellaria atrata CBS 101060]